MHLGSSRFSLAGQTDHLQHLSQLLVPKNGYVYIYASNESPVPVYFDNLQVIHTRGAILKETHYYPYGFVMAGTNNEAASMPPNKMKYEDEE